MSYIFLMTQISTNIDNIKYNIINTNSYSFKSYKIKQNMLKSNQFFDYNKQNFIEEIHFLLKLLNKYCNKNN